MKINRHLTGIQAVLLETALALLALCLFAPFLILLACW